MEAAEAAAESPEEEAAEGAEAGPQGAAERPLPQRRGAVTQGHRGEGPRRRRGRPDVTGVNGSVFPLSLRSPPVGGCPCHASSALSLASVSLPPELIYPAEN